MIACQGFSPFATSWESSWPVADGWGWCTGLPAFFRDAPGQPLSMAGFVWQFQTTCTRGPAQELTAIPDSRKRRAQIRRKNQEKVLARS